MKRRMLVFCKYSTPVQILFKMRGDVTLIFICYQGTNCHYVSHSLTHSQLQSAAVTSEITVCAQKLVIFILYYLNIRALPGGT